MGFNSFHNNQTIFDSGQDVSQFILIYSGFVDIIDNSGIFKLATLPAGSFFGEGPILFKTKSPFIFRTGVIEDVKLKN